MIKNEFLEDIIRDSEKNKTINKSIIIRLLAEELCNCNKEVSDHFKGIEFKKLKNGYGQCLQNGKIEIDYESIINETYRLLLPEETTLLNSLMVIYIMLHELEHLKEDYKITSNIFLESKILSFSSTDFQTPKINKIMKNYKHLENENNHNKLVKRISNDLYNESYEFDACEKIANYYSLSNLIKSLYNFEDFPIKYKNVFRRVVNLFYREMLLGYKEKNIETNFPLLDYAKFYCNEDKLKELEIYDRELDMLDKYALVKMDVFDKLKYNLPITAKEFKYVKSLILK